MILYKHSDAPYLLGIQARRVLSEYSYMGETYDSTTLNGELLASLIVLKNVISSATEAETGAL